MFIRKKEKSSVHVFHDLNVHALSSINSVTNQTCSGIAFLPYAVFQAFLVPRLEETLAAKLCACHADSRVHIKELNAPEELEFTETDDE